MRRLELTPLDPLAGQVIAQLLAESLEMDAGRLSSAAALFDAVSQDPDEARNLSRQVADTLHVVLSMIADGR